MPPLITRLFVPSGSSPATTPLVAKPLLHLHLARTAGSWPQWVGPTRTRWENRSTQTIAAGIIGVSRPLVAPLRTGTPSLEAVDVRGHPAPPSPSRTGSPLCGQVVPSRSGSPWARLCPWPPSPQQTKILRRCTLRLPLILLALGLGHRLLPMRSASHAMHRHLVFPSPSSLPLSVSLCPLPCSAPSPRGQPPSPCRLASPWGHRPPHTWAVHPRNPMNATVMQTVDRMARAVVQLRASHWPR